MPPAVSGALSDSTKNFDLVGALISQQSNTLAIVAIAATWLSILIAIISIYQNRKLKDDSKAIEKNIREIERYKKLVSNILSLLTIRLFNDVYTFRASAILLEELRRSVPQDDIEQSVMLHLVELSEYESDLPACENNQELIKAYEGMYAAALQILEAKPSSFSLSHFAYIKAIFSQYRIVRIIEPEHPENALSRIDDCFNLIKELDDSCFQLQRIYGSLDESYGHMENLHGLVYLWYVRIHAHVDKESYSMKEQQKMLRNAVDSFARAIEQGVHRKMPDQELVKFHNHRIAALLNLLFKWQEEYSKKKIDESAGNKRDSLYSELEKAFSEVKSLKMPDNYPKISVNYANYITTRMKIDYNKESLSDLLHELKKEDKNKLEDALDRLEKLIENKSTFVDVFYWHAKVGFLLEKNKASILRAILLGVYYQALHNGEFDNFDEEIRGKFEKLLSNQLEEGEINELSKEKIWHCATLETLQTATEVLDEYDCVTNELKERGLPPQA